MNKTVYDQIRADIYFSAVQKILKLDPGLWKTAQEIARDAVEDVKEMRREMNL